MFWAKGRSRRGYSWREREREREQLLKNETVSKKPKAGGSKTEGSHWRALASRICLACSEGKARWQRLGVASSPDLGKKELSGSPVGLPGRGGVGDGPWCGSWRAVDAMRYSHQLPPFFFLGGLNPPCKTSST